MTPSLERLAGDPQTRRALANLPLVRFPARLPIGKSQLTPITEDELMRGLGKIDPETTLKGVIARLRLAEAQIKLLQKQVAKLMKKKC